MDTKDNLPNHDLNRTFYFTVELPDGSREISYSLDQYHRQCLPEKGFEESLFHSFCGGADQLQIVRQSPPLVYSAAVTIKLKNPDGSPNYQTHRFEPHYKQSNLLLNPCKGIYEERDIDGLPGTPMNHFFFKINEQFYVDISLTEWKLNLLSVNLGNFISPSDIETNIEKLTGLDINDWRNLTFWQGLQKVIETYPDTYSNYPDTKALVTNMINLCTDELRLYVINQLRTIAFMYHGKRSSNYN